MCGLRTIASSLVCLLLWMSPLWAGVSCSTDDLLTAANEAAFDFANTTFTVSFWLTHTVATSGSGLVEKSDGTGWQIRTTSTNNSVRSLIKDSGGQNMTARTGTAAVNDGVPHHVAIVLTTDTTTNSSNSLSIYVDGVLAEASLTHAGVLGYTANNEPVVLCRSSDSLFFTGTLEDVRVYAGDVGAQAIALLAASRLRYVPLTATLVAYWPLDECAQDASVDAVAFADRAGNGHTLTGDNGANNTGLTCHITSRLVYPGGVQ